MGLRVFVTDDGMRKGAGPLLFLPDWPGAFVPAHPRAQSWRYFATVSAGDNLIRGQGDLVERAIEQVGFFVANRDL